MERYTMFLDWKNQHCENDYTTQSNLQIQCNPYQATNGIFHRTRTKNFTICMETQKTPKSQSNLGKEKWSWRNQASWLQTILQIYSNQDSMVLAQKQKFRSMGQDRKPRDKPTHIWSPYFGFVFVGVFSSFPLLFSSIVIWWLTLVLCLDSFFFFVCIYCRFFGLSLPWGFDILVYR